MCLSSFSYNWDNVLHVIKKIYSIINFKDSKCDIYNMEKISQSATHCSKVNLECVLKCNRFPRKQANGYMFETNCSSIEHQYNKIGNGFNKKMVKNKHIFLMLDNELLASSKKNWNSFPEILFFNQTVGNMWLQSPVFYV